MSTLLANPSEMIARGAPRLIHSDAELAAYTEALFELTALDHPSRSDADAIELLTLLIERYEQARFPIPAAKPVAVVRFLIERQGLTQRSRSTPPRPPMLSCERWRNRERWHS
jgi:HTH-type transcriptional regulator/antitoxin HigA